jgi:hypothetical protein
MLSQGSAAFKRKNRHMRQNRSNWKSKTSRHPRGSINRLIMAEALEFRRMLSAATTVSAEPAGIAIADAVAGSNTASGFTPTQIQDAYGINNIRFNTPSGLVTGNGAGQTIAIVDPTDNPAFVDSTADNFNTSDLALFDAAMGLPNPPSFVKVNYEGGTDFPAAQYQQSSSSYPSGGLGFANEIALDVEWTHAVAPMANILLVECPLNSEGNATPISLLQGGVNYASTYPGVSVVTMSFTFGEYVGETINDQYFTTPSGHNGVTFVAASGDAGDPGGYPAFSPNVLAVGATSLTLSGDSYASEVAHDTSGGGISQYESKPAYQDGETLSATNRTIPDVAFDGDENTGVPVYNSYDGGSSPWYKEGGTSFAAPVWASLIAIADQGRAAIGLGTLDGATQTLPRLYELSKSDYHDITSGSTDGSIVVSAGPGYDLTTGLGSPIANLLIPDLAGGNKVSGTVFNDTNANGHLDSGEAGLTGFSAFVNLYGTSTPTGADPVATSTSDGAYEFSDLPGGTFNISQATPAGWTLTTASTGYTVTLGFDSSVSGENIGFESNGMASQLAFVQQPSTVQASASITPAITVAVEDSDGNIVTSDHSAVTLAVTGGATTLTGQLTVNAVNGIATFTGLTAATAGEYTLVATDQALASATSSMFNVSSAPVAVSASLAFGQIGSTVDVGSPVIPAITVLLKTANNQINSSDDSAVTLTLAAGSTTNAPTGTLTVDAVKGIATFSDVVFTSAGTAILTASDGTLAPVTSSTFSAVVVPSQLVFAQEPTGTSIGDPISPAVTVDVDDRYGNLVTTDDSAVSLTVTGGTAALGGTTTVNAVNGVATFDDLTLASAGTFTLNATDGSLNGAQSQSFVSAVVVPSQLVFAQQPVDGTIGVPIAPAVVVDVEDRSGTTDTADSSAVTLTVNGGSATLGGTTTVNTVDGVATFNDLTLPAAGTYTLSATDGPLTAVQSNSFTLSVPGTVVPVVKRSTLALTSILGSKLHGAVALSESTTATAGTSGPVSTSIYAIGGDGATTLLGHVARSTKLIAGKNDPLTLPVAFTPAAAGTYVIQVQVTDPSGNISYASAGRIVVAPRTVTFTPVFTRLTLLKAVVSGTAVRAAAEVKITNSGNVTSTGTSTVAIYASPDGLLTDAMLITQVTPRLAIGATRSAVVTVPISKMPAGLDGNYTVLTEVTDSNLNVSSASSNTTVNIAPPIITLSATIPSVSPLTVAPGRFVTVTLELTNSGNIPSTGTAEITVGLSSDRTTQLAGTTTTIDRAVTIPNGKTVPLRLKIPIPASTTAAMYFPFVSFTQGSNSVTAFGTTEITVT